MKTSTITPPKTKSTHSSLSLADSLLMESQSIEREQSALINSGDIQQVYQEALSAYVQAKHGQVEAIEDRLELLISNQQSRLQQVQSAAPGLLSRPGARRAWQTQLSDQSARLQTLNNRLQVVREVKENVTLHGSKIEELATDKLQREKPDLFAAWVDEKEVQRIKQVQLQQEKKRLHSQSNKIGNSQKLGNDI
jgi:hypothetical protein